MTPLVAIVKKNKSVLDNLAKFLKSSQEYCYTDDKLNAPVLIIDDEVDQASVDTKDADELENASAINKGIRTILESLNRYAYVGYTATPFANVFIDPDKEQIEAASKTGAQYIELHTGCYSEAFGTENEEKEFLKMWADKAKEEVEKSNYEN